MLRALIFSQAWLVVQGRVVAYTWLVESGGSGLLPWLYLGQAVAIGLLTLALFGLVDRLGRASLLAGMFAVFALGIAVASGVPREEGGWAAPVFLLYVESGIAIVSVHFWLLASDLLSPEQSRRHFPSFTLAGGLGAISGGAAGHLASALGTRGMAILLLIPALGCCGLAVAAHNRYAYRVGPRAKVAPANFRADLSVGLGLVRGSQLLRWVGLLTALVTASGIAIDFLFTVSVAKSCSTNGLGSFFGNTNIAVSVAQLVLVAALGSRLLTTFGLFRTFSSYPLGGALVALLGAPFGVAGSAVLLKIFDRLENYVILNPGLGIALAAFPRENRGRASFVYGGLVKPLAMAITGTALLLLRTSPGLLWALIGVAFATFLPLLRRLAAVYRTALLANLGTNDARLVSSSIEALAERENREVVPDLVAVLEDSDDPVLKENVLRAAGRLGDLRFLPHLLYALGGSNSSMKIAAASSLGRFPGPEVQSALLAAVRTEASARVKASLIAAMGQGQVALYPALREGLADSEPRVRANAVEAIGLSGDPVLIGELLPLLQSASPREHANVIVALARVPVYREEALKALGRVFDLGDRSLLASALWAAGEVAGADYVLKVKQLTSDTDPMVRRNAIIALGKLAQADVVESMVGLLLGPRDDAMAMARALGRLGPRERESVLVQLSRLSSDARAPAINALTHCGLNYPDELDQLR